MAVAILACSAIGAACGIGSLWTQVRPVVATRKAIKALRGMYGSGS
jgi:hypothetical protein